MLNYFKKLWRALCHEAPSIYVIGSLRNEGIPDMGNKLREAGFDAFEEWHGAGKFADDSWKEYEVRRGRTYQEALKYSYAAKEIFDFDKKHIDRCDMAVLICPAGKSGFLELGYAAGCCKPTFILIDDPQRWDVMVQFATHVCFSEQELLDALEAYK